MSNKVKEASKQYGRVIGVLAVLLVIGAALRIYTLDSGLWFDEIKTLVLSVRSPLGTIVTEFPSNNVHVLYSVLAHLSITVFGESPWALRLPALLFGIASIPVLYLLGSVVTSRSEALLATFMLTFSYHHVWFSQNARGYTALLFWTLLSTLFVLQWILRKNRFPVVLYAIIAALGAYTHLTMIFIVMSHALICMWVVTKNRQTDIGWYEWRYPATAFILSGLVTLLLYAPMFQEMHVFFTEGPVEEKLATPIWLFWAAIRGLEVSLGQAWFLVLAGSIVSIGIVSYARQKASLLGLFLLPAPVIYVVALAMGRPIFPRFFFFFVGFGLLIAVRGAVVTGEWWADRFGLAKKRQRVGIVAGIILSAAFVTFSINSLQYDYKYPKQDYKQAMEFVLARSNKEEPVVTIGLTAAYPFNEYLGMNWQRIYADDELQTLRSGGKNVWVLYTFPTYLETSMPSLMSRIKAECTHARDFNGTIEGGTISVYKCTPVMVDQEGGDHVT